VIRITKIEFENYRQYKSISVSFDDQNENDLHILKAKNGTGKTTFLNGILWCLYAHEHYLSDKDKALPIVNNALVQSSEEKTGLKVCVRITLSNNGETIVFERSQMFFVTVNPLTGVKSAAPGSSNLRVIITPSGAQNTIVHEEDEVVQGFVKQYFDEAIYDYYFFDGENLKSYFSKGKSEKIKSSIFNIAQVTLLSNAAHHVRIMADERCRSASKLAKETGPDLINEISLLEEKIKKLEDEIREIDARRPTLKKKYEDADAALQGYAPIRINTEKRASLERDLRSLRDDYDAFKASKNEFIVTYLTLLNFYPRAKATLDLIREKQEKGTLPPNIDKEQIQELLDSHAKVCPVCDGALDERAVAHLKKLLEQLDVSSATSNFLMLIKGSLEDVVDTCKQFPEKYKEILQKEKYFTDEIAEKEKQADEISAFLAKYSDETGEIDVKRLEADRQTALDDMNADDRRKVLNESDIRRYKQELAQKQAEKTRIEEKNAKKDLLSMQVATLRKLTSHFELVQRAIMDEIKKDIQMQTWKRFDAMIWKKNTFGSLAINDSYELSVYNTTRNEMTGSLSATEYMALAYSFTLAIHDASGKNCPLVVDSPLGRVSDDNRANMAEELMKVSKKKQIIMLFTPDEYSDEVRALYDVTAASIRNISLSDDEDRVESVGE